MKISNIVNNSTKLSILEVFEPEAGARARLGLCTTCAEPITDFKDELSEREFNISGLCQKCQDRVFSEDSED
jgi:hypothetical protein